MTVTAEDLQWFGKQFGAIADNIENVIQGKRRTIELATISLVPWSGALKIPRPTISVRMMKHRTNAQKAAISINVLARRSESLTRDMG